MTTIDFSSGSESTWIASTYPAHGEDSLGRNDDFSVKFSKTISMQALTSDHFKIFLSSGEEVEDVFQQVDLGQDYNEITREITLKLASPLDADTEYAFVVDGLYDPSGDDQDSPHSVFFVTSDAAVAPIAEIETEDFIDATDERVNDMDIQITETPDTTGYVVTTTPTSYAYNLAVDYNSGLVEITFDYPIAAASVLVERRPISVMESAWSTVTPESSEIDGTTDTVYNVQLPEIRSGVWIEEAYEYRVTVSGASTVTIETVDTAIGDDHEFFFAGDLTPMFATINDVLFYFPGVEPYDIAQLIYLHSQYAMVVDTTIDESDPPQAATNYALYATLYRYAAQYEEAEEVELGDFRVKTSSEYGFADRFKEEMDNALSRLDRVAPVVTIKGKSHTTPFAERNWRNV